MTKILTLIDRASKVCGSDAELARRMGIKQSIISDMRHRGRTVTPETAAELAAVAGEDAQEAAIQAIIERAEGTRRGEVLKAILGKGVLAMTAVGVVTVSLLCAPDASASSLKTTFHDVYSDFLESVRHHFRNLRFLFC